MVQHVNDGGRVTVALSRMLMALVVTYVGVLLHSTPLDGRATAAPVTRRAAPFA